MIGKSSKKEKSVKFQFCFVFRSIRYNHDEPVQPRFELNAADLYIPSMAFVSYILVVGYMLGMQDRFAPDLLATTASSSLTMLVQSFPVVTARSVMAPGPSRMGPTTKAPPRSSATLTSGP